MTDAPRANAIVAQSGGPTGVINGSLVGVIQEAKKHPEIENLYGAIHAVAGIAKENLIDLNKISEQTLERTADSPAAAIGTSRDKPDDDYCHRLLEVFKKRNIRYFFYIGGNDSANTCYIISKMAREAGYELRAFHIPKTVDNDLLVTDHCPGFGTAAKFEAYALMGDDLDNRALPGIKIDVAMGRHAGFLTAATVLGKQNPDDGPHLVYVPERNISIAKFLKDVAEAHKKYGRCVVAVSEGICDEDGIPWAKKLSKQNVSDEHGNIQLSGSGSLADFLAEEVKKNIDAGRVRADTFGYLQRSFASLQSQVDLEEAKMCGAKAVEYSLKQQGGSVAIKRLSNKPYNIELFRTDLQNVAEKTKSMPDEFINEDGNGITQAFVDYAMPLTGGLVRTTHLMNQPRV